MKDESFVKIMNSVEKRAWLSFVAVCEHFLGNKKSQNYELIVNELIEAYGALGCNMSIKLHYLNSHLSFFPENLGKLSDEQGERFHQEIIQIENRYVGKSKVNMLSNYCWSLMRETNDDIYKKKRTLKHF